QDGLRAGRESAHAEDRRGPHRRLPQRLRLQDLRNRLPDREQAMTAGSSSPAPQTPPPPQPSPKPLKPQRALFAVLFAAFAIWVASLLWMYFTTEWPRRSRAHLPAPELMTPPQAPTPSPAAPSSPPPTTNPVR